MNYDCNENTVPQSTIIFQTPHTHLFLNKQNDRKIVAHDFLMTRTAIYGLLMMSFIIVQSILKNRLAMARALIVTRLATPLTPSTNQTSTTCCTFCALKNNFTCRGNRKLHRW